MMSIENIGLLFSIVTEHLQLQLMSVLNIFWTATSFGTKLGMMIHHHKQGCHAKYQVDIFKVKITGLRIYIWLFLLYIPCCWSFCFQILFDCTEGHVKTTILVIIIICMCVWSVNHSVTQGDWGRGIIIIMITAINSVEWIFMMKF